MTSLPKARKLDIKGLKLSDMTKLNQGTKKLSDAILKKHLRQKANKYLKRGSFQCSECEVQNKDGNATKVIPSMLKVDQVYEKLFEGAYIKNIDESVAKYFFKNILGYDTFFSAPAIVIRDRKGDTVDIVRYRPSREGYSHLPKYMQEKSVDKPYRRGEYFLYPFQIEMERLINKERYVFVGEGLKNALNALIRSIPFISIESTSNAANRQIAEYVNKLYQRGIQIYGAMDGDGAGKKAFNEINKLLTGSIRNLIDFDADIDFTEYLRKEQI